MTAVSGAAATVLTPLNFAFWAGLDTEASALLTKVAIEPTGILLSVALLLGLPMAIGMWVGTRLPSVRARARRPLRVICGLVFFGLVTSTVLTNAEHLTVALVPALLVVIAHNALALSTAYLVGRAFALPPADLRAVCVEVGIQNSGLALGIIFSVFAGLGGMAMIALLWGIWHIVAGSLLALFWSRRPLAPASA
jgi:BASS family bile acid:Na+ symporter